MKRAAVLAVALLISAPAAAQSVPTSRQDLESSAAAGRADAAMLRRLGEYYASGEGGRKDLKEAARLWRAAAEAGDRRAPILLADSIFEKIFGPPQPDGSRVRVGRVPRALTEEAAHWYELAFERDDRPEVRSRAQVQALSLRMMIRPR
jgi:TPR repeat protein